MKFNGKHLYSFLSLLIVFCLIFNTVALEIVNAMPGETGRSKTKNSIKADKGELPDKLPKDKLELTSKRTKYSTRYLNPDGSFTEEIYLEPKFYQDTKDKKWKPIDNALKASKSIAGKLENGNNNFKVNLADTAGTANLVTIEKDNKSVSMTPVGMESSKRIRGITKKNEVAYNGVFTDTDIKYYVNGGSVKEEIILNKYTNQNTFSFELKLKDLKTNVGEDGTIYLVDNKGNKVWYLEKPFMTDANGKYSDNVKLVIREENKKTFVDVIADEAFLTAADTKYPVVIDPTLGEPINDWDVIRDTYISSSQPNTSYSAGTLMHTGSTPSYGTTRSLVQFLLPSLPSGAKIFDSTLNLYQTKADTNNTSIGLYRTTSLWTGSTTWNTQPTINTTAESSVTSNVSNDYWKWYITKLTQDWYNGVTPNYGIMLIQDNEKTSPWRSFNTVNSGNQTPRITINYTVDPTGLEDFWGYTEDGVNPANGNLVLQETDVAVPGRGVPVSFGRTYNSRYSHVSHTLAYGWTSNVTARLVDSGDGPITLIDADNTRHIFGQDIYNPGGYVAHGGVYLDLVKNTDKSYVITQTDGTKINFNTSGKIASIVETNGNTTTYSYNTWGNADKITDASGRITTIVYNTKGFISDIIDSSNKTTKYEYDAANNLQKITDPELKVTTYGYDAAHNLTSITDARGITTTIEYDVEDRVANIKRPITIDGIVTTSTSTYSYDTANLTTTVTDGEGKKVQYTYNANGNIIQIVENPLDAQNKAVTSFVYDNNNNLVEVKDANSNKAGLSSSFVYTYDENGNVTSVKLPEGQTATAKYDGRNNMIKSIDFNGNDNYNDFDANNNNIEATDTYTQTSANRYYGNGNLQYSTYPMSAADNSVSNSSFEADNNTDNTPDNWFKATEAGKAATFSYSNTAKFGNKSMSISNPTGWAVITSNAIAHTANQKYIFSGYIKTTGTTSTAFVKVEYSDASGNWQGQSFAYGLKGDNDWTRVKKIVNDIPDTATQIRVSVGMYAGSGTAYFDGIQLEKGSLLSAYNLVDNSSYERGMESWEGVNLSAGDTVVNKSITDDNVYVGTKSFKIAGESGKNKLVKQRINMSGDASSRLTLSGWSRQAGASTAGGNYEIKVGVNDTNGNTIKWLSNSFRKTLEDWQHVAAEVNPGVAFSSIDVYYVYDNQAGTAWFDAMRLELGAAITRVMYDAKDNYTTQVISPNGDSVDFGYDTAGNRTSIVDGKRKETKFAYDFTNLLTKVTDAKFGVTDYEYDNVGNRTKVTDAKRNATDYAYNEFNMVSKITNPLNQAIQFGYDRNGNTTKLIFPKGDAISYTYNPRNLMDGIYYNGIKKWGIGYDANGNVSSVADSLGNTTTYGYDKNSRVLQVSKGSTNRFNYGYDNNDNMTSLTATAGSATVNTGYSYDGINQLNKITRNKSSIADFTYDERGNVSAATRANSSYISFEYDSNNRLESVKNYGGDRLLIDSYTYAYDANCNRTSVVSKDGTISYQYDELNQLTQETLLDGTVIGYEYDAAGNRTKKTATKNGTTTTTNYTYDAANQLTSVNGQAYTYDTNGNMLSSGSKSYVYDEENRLAQVKNQAGTVIEVYTYDHEGKRISMTTGGVTTKYFYSGDKVIYETDGSNNITVDYTYDTAGNPLTMTKNEQTYYYHINGHGDVTALTDTSGAVVAQYQYDAFGNTISLTGALAQENPYRYAGYRYDHNAGLYYLMARYYDAGIGRFITRDSFHGFATEPISLNYYAYGKNNPITMVDPDGNYPADVSYNELVNSITGKKLTNKSQYSSLSTLELLARTLYSEAFSTAPGAMEAVAWTIMNRRNLKVKGNAYYGKSYGSIVLAPLQYAGLTGERNQPKGGPNGLAPNTKSSIWAKAKSIAVKMYLYPNRIPNSIGTRRYFLSKNSYSSIGNYDAITVSGNTFFRMLDER